MLYGAMNFPVRPVLQELKAISGLGFDYLELTMDPPQAHHKIIRQQKQEFLLALEHLNMGLICHLPTFLYTADLVDSLREASLKEVLQSLEVAAELQPLKVVLHPSYIEFLSVFVMEQARQYALESLAAITEKAQHLGLCLCIENLFPRFSWCVNPEDFVEVFAKFPSLRLTLDIGHAHIASKGRQTILDFIDTFPDRVAHLHVSDNSGKRDDHLPVGTGTIDFPGIVKALKGIDYDATVTFEVFSRDQDYLKISRQKFSAMFAIE